MPSEISDEIVLVHPAVPPMSGLLEGRFFYQTVTGVNGVTRVQSALVPSDRYWWVQLAAVTNNDGVARTSWFALEDTVPNEAAIHAATGNIGTNVPFTFGRPFILPNDTRLLGRCNAIAAGSRLLLEFFYYELLHAEVNPSP